MKKLGVDDLLSFIDSSLNYHQEKWDKAEENERYRRVDHFDAKTKQDIESQGRQAYSIGLISSKGSQIVAEQRKNRTEWKVKAAIDRDDEIKAEIATIQLKDDENRCKFIDTESEQFDSGTLVHSGVFELYLDSDEDFNLVPNIKGVDYKNFMWDANSVDYNLEDALWVTKLRKAYRHQIEEEYGKQKTRRLTAGEYHWGRNSHQFYISPTADAKYDILTVFDFYLRVYRDYYIVLFNDWVRGKEIKEEYRTMKEAKKALKKRTTPYYLNGKEVTTAKIVKQRRRVVDKYTFTVDGILQKEETDMPFFPFSLYRAYHFKDQFWTLSDVLKSAQ